MNCGVLAFLRGGAMWAFWKKNEVTAKRSMVSVRMEAIGGQGANSAGKILAEASVLGMSYTGNHFSSFGSEKRGAPVRSFVRFSPAHRVVRSASAISQPDLLLVFHESLIASHPEILDGCSETTDLILNSPKKPKDLLFPKKVAFRKVGTVDATQIALKNHSGLNAVMVGAASQLLPEINANVLRETFARFFAGRSSLEDNLKAFDRGIEKLVVAEFHPSQASEHHQATPLPRLGYMNAPIGGVIANPGNTVLKDNSSSRKGIAPRFVKDLCFNCGYCDQVCPDYCFVWKKSEDPTKSVELVGIDYQYCKGCQKCVVACPVEALVPVMEADIPEDERRHRLFPNANPALLEEKWHHADWSKMIEDLSPQDRMMTLQTELLDPKSYLRPNLKKETP
jgi:pyruvate ferredoxin oxidoreductase gamma subunit